MSQDNNPLGRDADWILAMAQALGTQSGHSVPIVPDVNAFRKLFVALSSSAAPAVDAGQAPTVPAGCALVPLELTEEMHAAAVRTIVRCTGNDDFPPRVWRAMLAAAPRAPQASGATSPGSLLRKPVRNIGEISKQIPGGCHCPPDRCSAPVVMGRQTPCLRRKEEQ